MSFCRVRGLKFFLFFNAKKILVEQHSAASRSDFLKELKNKAGGRFEKVRCRKSLLHFPGSVLFMAGILLHDYY